MLPENNFRREVKSGDTASKEAFEFPIGIMTPDGKTGEVLFNSLAKEQQWKEE